MTSSAHNIFWGKKMAWGKFSLVGESQIFSPQAIGKLLFLKPFISWENWPFEGKGELFSKEYYPLRGKILPLREISPNFPRRENLPQKMFKVVGQWKSELFAMGPVQFSRPRGVAETSFTKSGFWEHFVDFSQEKQQNTEFTKFSLVRTPETLLNLIFRDSWGLPAVPKPSGKKKSTKINSRPDPSLTIF